VAIYEEFVGRNRDDFVTLDDLQKNYKVTYPETFNFAYDVMDKIAERTPDKPAILWVSKHNEEKRFTFGDVRKYSNMTANFFKSQGIKKGDRVLLVLKRGYQFWFSVLALHKIGAVTVMATNQLMAKDYVYRINSAHIKMAVITGDDDCTERFDEDMDQYDHEVIRCVTWGKKKEGWIDFDAEVAKQSDEWTRPTGAEGTVATDPMLMCFSSGTTGYPKMVLHDHTLPLGHLFTGVFWHRVEDGKLHFTISDTGWMKCMWGKFYGQWFGEATLFIYDFDKFNGADILKKICDYKITTFCAPPTMYRFMIKESFEGYDFSHLKHCCTAGEALNPEVYNQWLKNTGCKIYEGFGQSETSVVCGTYFPWVLPRTGSMGYPVPGFHVAVVDPDGNECPTGVTGEICIRTSEEYGGRPVGLLLRYEENPEAMAKSWHDGLYHTGDTAYRDELGFLWYVGRVDDVIKSSGYRIGPFEVESALMEHPAVLECAVTGVPDPVRGFAVKATIVLAKGYEPSEELTKTLQNHVKKTTAPYKYPRVVEYVDELPKTTSGKIKRADIRKKDIEKLEAK